MTFRIGIDLGGTKIEGIMLAPDGRILARHRVPAPRGDYQETVHQICALVAEIEAQSGQASDHVGIGIPGTLSPLTGLVKNANSTWLIGEQLDQDIADRLERPVRLANDANCFALSEAQDGAGQGASVVFGVILGTGVGGGLVVNGQIIEGRNSITGEWGHNSLPFPEISEVPGPTCYCGSNGCIETYLSGPGFAADFAKQQGFPAEETPTAEAIAALAEQGDAAANLYLERYENRLARALTSVINIIDPDVIVLGGGLSNLARLYDRVPPLLQEFAFSDGLTTELRQNQHGDASGVRGAAWLWPL